MEGPFRIVILGAGYAGMLATVRLAGRLRRKIFNRHVTITLVNAADAFVERLRLHQLAANRTVSPRPIAGILRGTGVSFLQGIVTGVDVSDHIVEVQTDTRRKHVEYDTVLYALGSTIDQDRVPGIQEYAYVLTPTGPKSAAALREALPGLNRQGGRLLVCGGGATGIEAAAEFAEAYPNIRVQLITEGRFGEFTTKPVADYMYRSLLQLGVTVQDQTTITQVKVNEVVTASAASLPHDICLWAGGFTALRLAREAGLTVNERGQILIDPFMRSVSHPEIYAAGDAAQPVETPGVAVRMAAYTAVVMGAHAADCLSARLQGKQPKPLSFAYAGQAIALGGHNAIGFNTYPIDHPNWPYFTGKTGYDLREFFVRLLADLPNYEQRWPGFFVWLGRGRYAAWKRTRRITSGTPAKILPHPGEKSSADNS